MSMLKRARNAAAIAAAVMLPTQAIAANPMSFAMDSMRAAATLEESNGQMEGLSEYLVPAVIVVALGLGIYFVTQEDDVTTTP